MSANVQMRLGVALTNIMESGDIGYQNFIERAVKVHQFLVANSPQMIESSGQDRTEIVSALNSAHDRFTEQRKFMVICILKNLDPIEVAEVTVGAVGAIYGTNVNDQESKMISKSGRIKILMDDNLVEPVDPELWTLDTQKKEKINQLYQGTVATCISQLGDLHRQLQPNTSWFSYCSIQ